MHKIIVEMATNQNIPELVKLEKICFDTDRLSASQFQYFIKKTSALVVVAKQNDIVVGDVVVLLRRNSHIARLYSIVVHPTTRQCGIAQLLHRFIEKNVQPTCTDIRLEVKKNNRSAINFYLKNGYNIFG